MFHCEHVSWECRVSATVPSAIGTCLADEPPSARTSMHGIGTEIQSFCKDGRSVKGASLRKQRVNRSQSNGGQY